MATGENARGKTSYSKIYNPKYDPRTTEETREIQSISSLRERWRGEEEERCGVSTLLLIERRNMAHDSLFDVRGHSLATKFIRKTRLPASLPLVT